ncbi:DUF4352 domain-containing protein [uncultured Oscillibacter sp.]|uniref:DUF4352 domain-containing protein n=1 Tax=uncultured Oscillibacter sp. TaxID=876091 RepID=UPI0025EA1165|nr:DUF4352 domain-containing protein [uncultured Oscillibacter sp.]
MKKLGSLVLAALLALALAGCDSIPGQSSGSKGGDGYAEDGYAEGRLGSTMHTYFFDYTVNSAYLCSEYEGYTPADGNELLVAEVTVKNTATESIVMWDDDFQAQWNDSASDGTYSLPITEETPAVSDEQLPDEYEMAVDEERTGLLVFEVPAGNKDFSISTMEYFDDGTEEGQEGDVFFVFFTAEAK